MTDLSVVDKLTSAPNVNERMQTREGDVAKFYLSKLVPTDPGRANNDAGAVTFHAKNAEAEYGLEVDFEPDIVSEIEISRRVELRAVPIQIWEGEVLRVDKDNNAMHVRLSAKIGNVPDHTAEISLEWVHPQDVDLIVPGGVFYWTLYKETKRGTITNAQDLRFRRLPNWSAQQVRSIHARAEELLSRGRIRQKAE